MAASTEPIVKIRFDTEKLEVIHDLWVWISCLLEQIFNPLMFVCAVYLILAYSLDPNSSGRLFSFCLGVLVAAPEFILCGAFLKSSDLKEQNNSKWWMLSLISWCFLGLTLLTVASLIYKLSDDVVKDIVVARCGLGILYGLVSMIAAMEKHKKKRQQLAVVQSIPELFVPYLQQLEQSHQAVIDQLKRENETALTQMRDLLTRDNQEQLTRAQDFLTQENKAFLTQIEGSNRAALTPLVEDLERRNDETVIRAMSRVDQTNQKSFAEVVDRIRNENEVALQGAIEGLEQASDRKVVSALTRIDRVRVILENTATTPTLLPGRGQTKMIEGSKRSDGGGQSVGVNDPNAGGQESEPSGVRAQKFIATYLAAEGSLPKVKMVMDATGCVKNTARKYLRAAGSTEQDEE